MPPIARALVLVAALLGSSPLLAQQLLESALKAFGAKIDAAIVACDIDTVVDHISELAVISGTEYLQGQMRMIRMNKAQYRELLTRTCAALTSQQYSRTNEKIAIDGDQATITADVAQTMVVEGQPVAAKFRERVTVESIDGKLMLTQLVMNQAAL